jgi:nucleotide-binding universal stress UspA family protein
MIKDNELKAIAKDLLEKHAQDSSILVGIRSTREGEEYKIGDDAQEAYDWDYDQDVSMYDVTGETAGWTATTGIKDYSLLDGDSEDEEDIADLAEAIKEAIDFNGQYGSDTQVILFGKDAGEDANDERELDLVDALVVGVA